MENKNLTAVQWLEEQLNKWSDGRFYLPPHLFEQAKQMEKEIVIEAFDTGCQDEDRIGIEYYNETFTSTPQGEIP